MPLTQRIGTRFVAHRSGVSLRYLLRATFNAPNQGFANAQVLDTVAEGVQDGQLTVVEVDGTLAISGNACAFTAQSSPTWGDLGFYSQAITRALGRGFLSTVVVNDVTRGAMPVLFSNAASMALATIIYYILIENDKIDIGVWNGAGNPISLVTVGTPADSTEYQLAIVLGGYDAANGVPWRSGQAATSYLYGAAFFIKGGAFTNWTLLWRTSQMNTATLYAASSSYSAVGTIELPSGIPDADLSAVLQPMALSTFGSSGELSAYAPDVGGGWTEDIGDWDTDGASLVATALGIATFTGLANCLYDAKITTPASGMTAGGLVLRVTDLTGASEDYWYVKITPGTAGTDWELIEYAAGTPTQRAFGDADWAAVTAYQIRAICYGSTIACFRAGAGKITYASATSGQTATTFGLQDEGNANMTFDNVVLMPRTSSVYNSVLGGV